MMAWTSWILLSAVFLAFYDLAKKASVRNNAVLSTLLCSTLFGCMAFMLGIILSGALPKVFATVNGYLLVLAAAKSIIVATSWIFTFYALRTLPISIATPIRASAPALVFVAALFLYGEVPTLVQGIGMLTVFVGYWAFSWAGKHEGINFLHNRAVWSAFAGAFFSALSSIWDKYVFQVCHARVETIQFFFQIGLVLVYGSLLLLTHLAAHAHAQDSKHANAAASHFEWRWTIPFVGIFLAMADWLYFTGLAYPEAPISVGSLMRRVSVVITFILGAKVFHETNLRRKALALAAILVGVALLCVP